MARFLIVDDDPACRRLLEHYLKPFGDCDLAENGAEGASAFRKALQDGRPYDLVCLDLLMPEQDGHTTVHAIRTIEAEHDIFSRDRVKVIMTTAVRDVTHCVQAYHEGCESYLTKPIDPAKLLQRLRELGLDQAKASTGGTA